MSKVCPTCETIYDDSNAFCPTDGTTLRASDVEAGFIGTVIAERYVITDLLGEGGMGKVYLARHVRLPRQAAIKVLHPHMVADPAALARFNREASNASLVDHERVAKVFDFGETSDGLVFLAMEYITGKSLKQVLKDDAPLPIPRTVGMIRQIADGLDAAHKMNIVHRDLKPDNIIVSRDDAGNDQCKVVDFGIAKAIGSGEKALTRTGFVIGTPEYMSPEQLMGEEIDHRSDIYALALVAYQCFTSELPFDGSGPDRGMMARLTSQPRLLTEARPDRAWPSGLQAVLNKALDRQRDNRYASAGAFAAALEAGMKSAVAAPSALLPPPPPPPKKKPPTPVTPQPTPVAVPSAQKAPASRTPVRGGMSAQPIQSVPIERVSAMRPARRRMRLPRIPLVRWATTAAVIGFGWLVLTEGSINRALRRATGLARNVESSAIKLADRAGDAAGAASSLAGGATAAAPAGKGGSPAGTTDAASGAPASTLTGAPAAVGVTPTTEAKPSSAPSSALAESLAQAKAQLRSATSASDSVSAFIRVAKIHHEMGEKSAACSAVASARAVATTDAEKEALTAAAASSGCSL